MPISKLQAAQQQLDCSIRLLFNEDDMSSVITLSRAAFRVFFDIYPVIKPESTYGDSIAVLIRGMGWDKFNQITNQLKHADKDPEAMIDPHPVHAMIGIGIAITFYHQLTGNRMPEMQAFESIMSTLQPDVFGGPHDPDAEGYADFMKAVAKMKNATHSQLMEFGLGALHYLKTGNIEKSDPDPPMKN
jgi:hypothetical protein